MGLAASESAGGFAQLVNLRTFQPRFLVPGRQSCPSGPQHRRHARAHAVAPDIADLLRSSQPLVAPASPPAPLPVEFDQLPAAEDWHRHPELLQGQVAATAAASRRLLPTGLCVGGCSSCSMFACKGPKKGVPLPAHLCLQMRARRSTPAGGTAAQRRRGQQPGAASAQGGRASRHCLLPAGAVPAKPCRS